MKWYITTGGCKFLSLRLQTFAGSYKRLVSSSTPYLQTKNKLQNDTQDRSPHTSSTTRLHIYEGPVTRMVKGVKIFSFSTSFLGLMCQPILISKTLATSSVIVGGVGAFIAAYSILTPIVLHWIVRRYVVQLYFDSNTKSFTAVTLGFFNKEKKLEFNASDVFVPEVESPLTTFMVQDKPMLVDPERFTDLKIYGHLMGFDKPVDLQLGKEPTQASK